MSRAEAKGRLDEQIERGKTLSNVSINVNSDTHRWYEYLAELLRQLYATDESADEFPDRSSFSFEDVDITVGHCLEKLRSLRNRLELYSEETYRPPFARNPPSHCWLLSAWQPACMLE